MKYPFPWKIATITTFAAAAFLCAVSFTQQAGSQQTAAPDAQKAEVNGMAPRSSPGDYQAHAQLGKLTIAADFTEHSIAPPDATYNNDQYVTAEVAIFGSPDSKLQLSTQNFSMKINGKKMPEPAVEFAAVFHDLKDPLYVSPDEAAYKKAKAEGGSGNGLSSGGGGNQQADQGNLPPIIHIPITVERAMQQKVRLAALPEGERPLPVAGLVFFEHRGRVNSAELMYNGPAGKVTLRLQ
jgi:hypothetical protein